VQARQRATCRPIIKSHVTSDYEPPAAFARGRRLATVVSGVHTTSMSPCWNQKMNAGHEPRAALRALARFS